MNEYVHIMIKNSSNTCVSALWQAYNFSSFELTIFIKITHCRHFEYNYIHIKNNSNLVAFSIKCLYEYIISVYLLMKVPNQQINFSE